MFDYYLMLKKQKQHLLWIALALCGFCILFFKAKYGFGGDDEAFYLTIPHRFIYGDVFIKDEWHLSQLSAFLNIPFVWIYYMIVGSTDSIILTARYYYVIIHFFFSFLVYYRLKNYGVFSVMASIVFLVFVPFNISTYSYNSMCVDFLVLMGVFMSTCSEKSRISVILSGIFYASAVLCCPYLAIIIIFYIIAVAVEYLIKRKNNDINYIFRRNQLFLFCLGILVLAIAFLLFFLLNHGYENLFENIKLLMSDPEHSENGLLYKTKIYILDIIGFTVANKIIVIYFIIHAIIIVFDKKRKQHKMIYLMVDSVATIIFTLLLLFSLGHECYNAIVYPFALFGLVAYCLLDNKPKKVFLWIYLIGFIYSFAVNLSSNTCFYVIMMAMIVPDVATCIFIGQLIKESYNSENVTIYAKRVTVFFLSFVVAFQISIEAWSRLTICFSDKNVTMLTEKIVQGPAKGIVTTKKNKLYYDELYNDLQFYKSKTSKRILCFTDNSVSYLIVDFPYGSFSAWTSGVDINAQNRLNSYYMINNRNIPNYVYLKKSYYKTRYDTTENIDFLSFRNHLEESGYRIVEENDVSVKYEKND